MSATYGGGHLEQGVVAVTGYIVPAPHEFAANFLFNEHSLAPFFAADSRVKEGDGSQRAVFTDQGEEWTVTLYYQPSNIVHPGERLPSGTAWRLDEMREFRMKIARHSEEDPVGEQSFNAHLAPRWAGMEAESNDGTTHQISVPDGLREAINIRVQGSNIEFSRYRRLLRKAASAVGIRSEYFEDLHEFSNVQDAERYVRVHRNDSGPIHSRDGPIASMGHLLEHDRQGYRKVVQNDEDGHGRTRPGYYHTVTLDPRRIREAFPTHALPKEVKHYYMKDPDNYDPDEFGWHPKLEIGYQTSVTDRTVYWDRDDDELDRHDLRRELEELLVNVLDWSGLDLTGGEQYQKDAYFKPDDRERRSLKLVDCPLPEIESQQEQTIMRLWGDMNPSDRAVVDTLLTDGGEISPQDAADETGFCYDTILRAVDRLEGFVEHTYGELAIESDYAAQAMLKRVRSAEEQFRRSIGSTAMQVADDAQGVETDALERFVRNYDVGIDESRDDCRALLKPRYVAADREDAKNLAREAYTAVCDRHGSAYGFHMRVELADGSVTRFRDLNQGWAGSDWDHEAHRRKRERQLEEQAALDDRNIDPDEIDLEEAWTEFADRDEWVTYSTLRLIISSVASDVERAHDILKERGEIVTEEGRGFGLAPR